MTTTPERDAIVAAIGLAATGLGLALARVEVERLAAYVALLARWNATYNLTSVRDPMAMVAQHIADCLAVVEPLRRELRGSASPQLLDVGTGAGLPAIVLAAVEPSWRVTCVDAVGKKVAFVRQAATDLVLPNIDAVHGRVESLPREPVYRAIVSRAFASLSDFVAGSRKLLAADGVWMAMKGHIPSAELAMLPAGIHVFHVEQLSVSDVSGNRSLIWMKPQKAQSKSERTL